VPQLRPADFNRGEQLMSSIIEKVRKLFAHAESAGQIGNQAEAEAFAAKAQELMLQHKLDSELLTFTEDEPEEQVDIAELDARDLFGTKTVTGWRSVLFNGLAKAHFCRLIRTSRGRVALVGAPSDREVVVYILTQLLRVAPGMAKRAVPDDGWRTRANRNAWLIGFASGINAKLREARAAATRNPNALVVLNRAQERVDAAFREAFPKTTAGGRITSRGSADAYKAGREAGRSHNIHHGVRGGSRSAAGRVTAGALMLGSGR
jgi:hypothetical protein